MFFLLFLCISLTRDVWAETILPNCTIVTPTGIIINGRECKSRNGIELCAYNGIPYAEPPIGDLRFRSPVPIKSWNRVIDATRERCECKQLNIATGAIKGSENCLYINVYAPKRRGADLLPVLVYIPGGSFGQQNGSKALVGPEYFLDKPVVLVSFNYRLDVFGFLSTGDEASPGNFGLKDQVVALEWVQEYISCYGGDRNEVTLFGEGAGAESVHLHMLSSKSQNLFKRAIAQSGNALYPFAFTDDSNYYEKAKQVARRCNCPTDNSNVMIECLRKVKSSSLVRASITVFDEIDIATKILWIPTKEPETPDAFLTDTPENLIRQNRTKNCPFITGTVQDEGTLVTRDLLNNDALYDRFVNEPVDVIEKFLSYYSPLKDSGVNIRELAEKAKNFYLGSTMPDSKELVIERYTNLVTEFFFLFPSFQLIENWRTTMSSLMHDYVFDYHGTITATLGFGGNLGARGVGHASDLFSEFPISPAIIGQQYSELKPSAKDFEIVDIMIDLWTSFATDSVPVSPRLSNPKLWQPQVPRNNTHLKIGSATSADVTLESEYDRATFWFQNAPTYKIPLD